MARQKGNNVQFLTKMHRQRAAALGISDVALRVRLHRGWSVERATGQTARLKSPNGTRQRYQHVGGSRWARLAHSAASYMDEHRTVRAICADEGLPFPKYQKSLRRSPPPRPVKPKAPPPVSTDEHHRPI